MTAHHVIQGSQAETSLPAAESRFTERELQIVTLIVDGLSNRSIGERLQISPRTVQAHVASAMRKTRVNTRTQLAVGVLRAGLVHLPPAPGVLAGAGVTA